MLKELIKEFVAPLLKQAGFKKKGLCWNKVNDDFTQVIEIQKSKFSDDGVEDFTFNIGIYNQLAWATYYGEDSISFVSQDSCLFGIRASRLIEGNKKDKWWSCSTETDNELLGNELGELIQSVWIPFLDSLNSFEKIHDHYISNDLKLMPIDKIYLAIIKSFIGEKKSSDLLLSEVSSISEGWKKRVANVASRL